jgi:amidase
MRALVGRLSSSVRFINTRLLLLVLTLLAGCTSSATAQNPLPNAFDVQEASVADIHAAFAAGTLTCRQLVGLYLDRIRAYDRGGPKLNTIIMINPKTLDAAAALDAQRQNSGRMETLHCIPVLLKDSINTADMPTSVGSAILKNSLPPHDATIVTALRDAGAIILGKASMGELSGGSYNTVNGQAVNPYNFKRGTGGSSTGSAAAVAANFTALAVGGDTLTSVRAPAAWTGIVGLRPTTGLISRNGIAPRKVNIDTAGPMARTVTDMALLLNVLAGPDPADQLSLQVFSQYPASEKAGGRYADFTQHLKKGVLKEARIGVVRDFFGGDPEIDALARSALAKMEEMGAQLVDVHLDPDFFDRYVRNRNRNLTAILMYRFRESWEAYLATLGPDVPKSVAEWVKIYETELSKTSFPPETDRGAGALTVLKNSLMHSANEAAYRDVINNVLPNLTRFKLAIYEQYKVDALVFPYRPMFAPPISNPVENRDDPTFVDSDRPNPESLGGYSSIGFPMIVVPMGFGTQGLPMGIAFMGRPYEDGRIIGYAYDYEQATKLRRPSPLLPPLPGKVNP